MRVKSDGGVCFLRFSEVLITSDTTIFKNVARAFGLRFHHCGWWTTFTKEIHLEGVSVVRPFLKPLKHKKCRNMVISSFIYFMAMQCTADLKGSYLKKDI